MLSLPFDFSADTSAKLGDLLSASFGPYGVDRWRAFRYLRGGPVEWSPAHASDFRLLPGRAYWLISADAHQVKLSRLSLSTAGAESTLVLEPGPLRLPLGLVHRPSAVDDRSLEALRVRDDLRGFGRDAPVRRLLRAQSGCGPGADRHPTSRMDARNRRSPNREPGRGLRRRLDGATDGESSRSGGRWSIVRRPRARPGRRRCPGQSQAARAAWSVGSRRFRAGGRERGRVAL